MATMAKRKKKGVSLSGKTRLTFREAFALFEAAQEGKADWDERADEAGSMPESEYKALERAISKLYDAMADAGATDDPFDRQRWRDAN